MRLPRMRLPGMRLGALCAVLAVSACVSGCISAVPGGERDRRAASRADRIVAECALLAEAETRMSAPHAGLREGCPGESARDARPLAVQTASLRRAGQAALPAGIAPGSRAETVFRRMITRGVPVALAQELAASAAFAVATR